jgi:hypothetical protein
MTRWLARRPRDPLGKLVASFHLYNFNECIDPRCWDAVIAPIAACGRGGPSLISSVDGTPTPFGAGFRAHLLMRAADDPA